MAKKRKPRNVSREAPSRESYERVLVVCEGSKTEPNYLKEIAKLHKLSTANITIDGSGDSSPISVVNHAIDVYEKDKRNGGSYDKVFCVYDRDTASTFQNALDKVRSFEPPNVFIAITSIPCFEYWILLHFQFTTQPFNGTSSSSACNQVISLLNDHLPGYTKGIKDLHSQIRQHEAFAIDNATRSRADAERNGCDNPTTFVDQLVMYLSNLKK